MSDLLYWKSSKEGHGIVAEIQKEKETIRDQITDGFLLNCKTDSELARVYAEKIGQLKGLDLIERLIQDDKSNTDEERDII